MAHLTEVLQTARFWGLVFCVWLVALAAPALLVTSARPPGIFWAGACVAYLLTILFAAEVGSGLFGSRLFCAVAPVVIFGASFVLLRLGVWHYVLARLVEVV